jgi:hypothetical protein
MMEVGTAPGLCPGVGQQPDDRRPVRGRGPLREHGRCPSCHKWMHLVWDTRAMPLHYPTRGKPQPPPRCTVCGGLLSTGAHGWCAAHAAQPVADDGLPF